MAFFNIKFCLYNYLFTYFRLSSARTALELGQSCLLDPGHNRGKGSTGGNRGRDMKVHTEAAWTCGMKGQRQLDKGLLQLASRRWTS